MIGLFGDSIPVGTMTDVVVLTPTSYRISSSVTATMICVVLPGDTALRTSEGSAGGGAYLTSCRFTEKRGNGELRLVTLDCTKRVASYFKSGKISKREAIKYRTADVAALPK